MTEKMTIRVAQRGVLTLPKSLRETYNLKTGDVFTLIDLNGVFILSPLRSEVDALADRITGELIERGETLESMLKTLREEREHYASDV